MPAALPPNPAWGALDYAPAQPWFAQRLERAGVPTKRVLVKEEVRFKKSDTSVAWTGHDLGAVAEVDDEPDEDAEEHFEPAIYDYRVPACLAALQPNDVVAVWAARNWTPEALEALRALTQLNPSGAPSRSMWTDRDVTYKENLEKMYEDAQRSERPEEDLNSWEKDM